MRKVTKILGKVLSAAVLLLIVLPLALSLLLSINAVQNFVVDRAAQFASRKLETVVRIDRVDIGIFDRITLEGLYVEDYGGDTLLYVGKLHAFITQFGIFSNGFTLRHGRLTDGKFYLREMPDGVMNVKQIVSRMGRKEKKEESAEAPKEAETQQSEEEKKKAEAEAKRRKALEYSITWLRLFAKRPAIIRWIYEREHRRVDNGEIIER